MKTTNKNDYSLVMKLNIRLFAKEHLEKTMVLDVDPEQPIEKSKVLIKEYFGCKNDFKMIFCGKVLTVSSTFAKEKLSENSTIICMENVNHAPTPASSSKSTHPMECPLESVPI
jgi:hypothetical protein